MLIYKGYDLLLKDIRSDLFRRLPGLPGREKTAGQERYRTGSDSAAVHFLSEVVFNQE